MEIETLRQLALIGAHKGQIDLSPSILTSMLEKIPQTAARRLLALDEQGCIEKLLTGEGRRITILEKGLLLLIEACNGRNNGLFEGSRGDTLRGRLVSGLGEGQYYLSREGYLRQFREKLGFEPFPGTLTIKLDGPFDPSGHQAIKIEGFLDEGRTFGECICYRANVKGIRAAMVRPARSSYPPDLVEIVAPISLRRSLGLADGDEVELALE